MPSDIKKYEIESWLTPPELIKINFLVCRIKNDNVRHDWKQLHKSLPVSIDETICKNLNLDINSNENVMARNCYCHIARLYYLCCKYIANGILTTALLSKILIFVNDKDNKNYLYKCGAIIISKVYPIKIEN